MLCRLLWTAVESAPAQEAKDRNEAGAQDDDDAQFIDYPVRLTVDGLIAENRKKAMMEFRNELDFGGKLTRPSDYLYDLFNAKKPAALLICSLQPATWELGLEIRERGIAGLYREPRIDVFAGNPYAGRRVSSQANSPACFALIAHWIRTCVTQHEHCYRARCPHAETDEMGTWARSPSYASSWEPPWGRPSTKLSTPDPDLYTAGLESHAKGPGLELEESASCPAPFLYCSEPEDKSDEELEERPRKRARISRSESKDQEAVKEQPNPHPPRYGPDPAIAAANKKSLEEATLEQVRITSGLERRTALSRGVLSNREHAPKITAHDGSEYFYDLYYRTDDLRKLQTDAQRSYHAERILKSAPPPPPLPTRYIHVDSNPPQLRIAEPDARGFYIALSHCWGKSRPLVTTTATLSDRMAGIPMKTLPRTFQDAVTITRELGLEYLWIDSLCILQDSRSDWVAESAKMGSVYSNAFLTISAAASTDSEQGIFRPRSIPPSPPVQLRCHDSNMEPIYIDHRVSDTPFETPQSTDTRAWCFQELALSPRVIVYGREMLGFMCDTMTDVEHGELDLKEDLAENPNPPLLAPRLLSRTAKNPVGGGGV
jgi:hypothetical protein